MRIRGVALPSVLGLIALVLTIGLALGTVSMMALNLSRREYLNARATLIARSAVTQFISQVSLLEGERPVQLFQPQPLDLKQIFPRTDLFEGCWISFDLNQPGYSTDNSSSSQWAQGWLDRGTTRLSVPPFSVDLLLHTRLGGFQRDYRAVLRRVWPYAIYSAAGGILLTGNPEEPGLGSTVQGDIYAQVTAPSGIPRATFLEMQADAWSLFDMFTKGFQPERDHDAPIDLGPSGTKNASIDLTYRGPASLSAETPYSFGAQLTTMSKQVWEAHGGNVLQGSVFYSDTRGRKNLKPRIGPGDRWTGTLMYRNQAFNPLSGFDPSSATETHNLQLPGFIQKTQASYWTPPRYVVVKQNPDAPIPVGPHPTYVLWGALKLAGQTHYHINGSLTNSLLNESEAGSTTRMLVSEYGCSLEMDNCVLTVDGDLELNDFGHPAFKGIQGNGSTLIVNGTLSLSGGRLNAGDQGMVILARDVCLSGSGTFHGLLIALNSISILPVPGQRLTIHGGVVTGGAPAAEGEPGITLRNVDLLYDARYMKCLNSYGDYQLNAWEAL